MPTFDTPQPIVATIEMAAGSLRVGASKRADTVVDVRPTNPASDADVRAAERTRVEYASGRLLVKAPKDVRYHPGRGGSVAVGVELPEGSEVSASTASADVGGEGRLGDVTLTSASGDLRIERTANLRVKTARSDVTVTQVDGHAAVDTASGHLRIGAIDGNAIVKSASGDSTLGVITGHLRLHAASGDISVDRALASVVAKTASGDVHIGEVVGGSVALDSASGELNVGVAEGTAAWLDASSLSGRVHSTLDAADAPAASDRTVEIRARTLSGDITVHRARHAASALVR